MPRIRNLQAFTDRPFEGQGVSLYVQTGDTIRYRNLRILGGRPRGRTGWIKGQGGLHNIAADSVQKTARVASSATSPLVFDLPAGFASQPVTFDLRHYQADVENLIDNFRTVTKTLAENLDDVATIFGTATLLNQEVRAAGIVRLRFAYHPSRDGTQPTVFKLIRTAGPTSPADATLTVLAGTRNLTIDTPQLQDSAPYTYKLRAQNSAGTITKDLLTGITVQSDNTGPDQPTNAILTVV